ncbi:MAG: class I SAM-dependent RNA methyltransferase [Acidobacteriaceae bacterium]
MSTLEQLRIEKAVYGGAGLARLAPPEDQAAEQTLAAARKTVFVPFALPGELVEAKIVEDKGSFANASLARVLEPSPDRVSPLCPHFGVCGGCHYQHASYGEQLAMKANILRETLERARLRDLPPIKALHASALLESSAPEGAWAYRNRIRFHVASTGHDLALGYRKSASHEVVLVVDAATAPSCPIATPLLLRAAKALVDAATESPTAFALLGGCAEVEMFCNADQAELQMALYQRESAADGGASDGVAFRAICDLLSEAAPQLVGGGLYAPATQTSRGKKQPQAKIAGEAPTMAHKQVAAWGIPTLRYRAAGGVYRVARGAFFQVNRWLADDLVSLVAKGRSGALAWDLYAGVGLFSRVLMRGFKHVVAVETASPANKDLAFNLESAVSAEGAVGAERGSRTAVAATTLDFLQQQTGASNPEKRQQGHRARFQSAAKEVKRSTPDLIVVDPPRAGLGREVCELLGRVAAPELIYVSCDPATLSRDLVALVESGYKIQQLHLVDMFPQTFHLETVAVLHRS